ncbi:MAG TPA: response regulator transcription factor [Anaerolineae bacterium]|nr:response regulator transcription factor [Anaerolineae bacterium]
MGHTRRILVVDDDRGLRKLLVEFLEREGYDAVPCGDGAGALRLLTQEHFDLLLADIRMSGMSGMDLLARVRAIPMDIAVIMMTGYGSKETAIGALRGNVKDYLEKPFTLHHLRASILRALPDEQPRGQWRGARSYAGLTVDVDARRVLVDGAEVDLTKTEFDLLAYLLGCLGCPVPTEELLAQVWGDPPVASQAPDAVKSCVWRLRKKLGDSAAQPRYVRSIRGFGYQLGGEP